MLMEYLVALGGPLGYQVSAIGEGENRVVAASRPKRKLRRSPHRCAGLMVAAPTP